jgi:actin-like ATPase involved in cell morphogenesis
MAAGLRLGIDFGSSHTVAVLGTSDGRLRPLLFDGSPLLPSAVYAGTDGRLLVGRDALHAARVDPSRFEATPKRRIDDGTVLLGDRAFNVSTLVAAVLAHVGEEATRVGGGPPETLTLSHPASWGVSRRLALLEGAKLAGLPQPVLVAEPVAAAQYFVGVLGRQLGAGQGVLIYDFGGGTFDASMVVATPGGGFEVKAVDGIDDLGGLDLDALVVDYVRAQTVTANPQAWARLDDPQSTEDRRHRRLLWDDARTVKEMLSRTSQATIHVPLVDGDTIVPREAFEQKAQPLLEQTVRTTRAVLRWSELDMGRVAGVFLVGGSSRIPLIATLLHRELGVAPTVIEQPEMVVAEGSLLTGRPGPAQAAQTAQVARPAPASPMPVPVSPAQVSSAPVSPAQAGPPPTVPRHPQQPSTPLWPADAMPHTVQRSFPRPAASPVPKKKPRRWAVPVLSGLLVLALLAIGYVVGRPLLAGDNRAGDQQTPTPAVTTTKPGPSPTPYQRLDRPDWVPASWSRLAELPAEQLWQSIDEKEGGRCNATGDTLRVTRPTSGIVGCTLKPPLDGRQLTDVAVETELTVNAGCGGLWSRTGARGYLLAVCGDMVNLHRLGDDPPSAQNRIGHWRIDNRGAQVVGLLTRDQELSVYVNGSKVGSAADAEIRRGKVNAGGYSGQTDSVDVVFQNFRVFAPPTEATNPAPSVTP